ncbi:FAD-binding oxidoreductase [Thermodesulforhabdus norvegica]|uniref:Glycolate oxidase n=1 Tax=Thermodesulforhabdus norvegica TaxID=39841 RepID=A0A1I4W6V8_9BACT|nr:FAD-linked oxidase C-terminal domain-containing protein [Thermodesulforhabdus norvegica]SFN09183.1 glycolate oxidase [Thermodesulforhabdus norvegica]
MAKRALIGDLEALLGAGKVLTEPEDRAAYSYDAAVVKPVLPLAVVRPETEEELGKVVAYCHRQGIPLTVRGAGTNLSGGTVPHEKGIVILTGKLDKIVELNPEDMYAVVQPGVITANFAKAVEKEGLFYPPDPGSQAVSTLGGNVAENAGGLRGLKYGVTRDYVLGLEFFSAEGDLIRTGSRTVKCVSGYNLAGLLVGSEGTLGVISRIILRLIPYPAAKKSMMALFSDLRSASETVAAIIAARVIPATLEFMDRFTIDAVERFSRAGLPGDIEAMLLIEVDGHPAQVKDEAEKVEKICRDCGALKVRVAENEEERNRVWEARRSALSALAKLRPTVVLEDATVPRSKIPEMVQAIQDIAQEYKVQIGTFGHAGDGNLHPTILTDRRNHDEWRRVEGAVEAIFEAALKLGGTLSGEHGIGIAKAPFLHKEVGRGSIEYSRRIKRALDSRNILNPGKILWLEGSGGE